MKSAVTRLVIISAICFSSEALTNSDGMTPDKLKVYVETLRELKAPVSSAEVIVKLTPIFGADLKVREKPMEGPMPDKSIGIWMEDKFTHINLQLPPTTTNLGMPNYNVLTPFGESSEILNCGSNSKWFESLRIGDLVKMYGPWVRALDGSKSEYRQSMFVFKSGVLKIKAYGCYRTNPKDIRVHMLSVKWPQPGME